VKAPMRRLAMFESSGVIVSRWLRFYGRVGLHVAGTPSLPPLYFLGQSIQGDGVAVFWVARCSFHWGYR